MTSGLNDIAMCKGAAAFLIAVNKRKPPIDCFDESGVKPSTVKGKISFRNINFWYPTRPDVQVLKKVSGNPFLNQLTRFFHFSTESAGNFSPRMK